MVTEALCEPLLDCDHEHEGDICDEDAHLGLIWILGACSMLHKRQRQQPSSSNTQLESDLYLGTWSMIRKRRLSSTQLSMYDSERQNEPDALESNYPLSRSLDEFLEQAVGDDNSGTTLATKSPWRQALHQWRYWALFLSLGVANSSDAAEILCLSYILSDDAFDEKILNHTPWKGGLLAATVFAGMLLGGLFVGGNLGDVYGRRPILLLGLATNSLAGLLSAAAWDAYSLSILRFVAGIGIGTTIPPLFTLCSELAAPRQRGLCVTIAASFWMVGSIYVALAAWWILGAAAPQAWRQIAAVCAVPSALGWMLVYTTVPESPRYLLLQARYSQATMVAQDVAFRTQFTGPAWTVQEARQHAPEPIATLRGEQSIWGVIQGTMDDFAASARQLFVPQMRRTTWPLQMVWFTLSFGSYGLYTWINTLFFEVHLHNVYFNALLFALSNLPGNILSAILMDRVGRSSVLVWSIVGAATSLMVFAFVAFRDEGREANDPAISTNWIVLSACSFQMFTIISWNAIDVLTSELFPTTVRATGMGLCAASGRIGAMLAQFINGTLVAHPVALLLVAATALLLGALTPSLLPRDLTGRPVSDTVEEGMSMIATNEEPSSPRAAIPASYHD